MAGPQMMEVLFTVGIRSSYPIEDEDEDLIKIIVIFQSFSVIFNSTVPNGNVAIISLFKPPQKYVNPQIFYLFGLFAGISSFFSFIQLLNIHVKLCHRLKLSDKSTKRLSQMGPFDIKIRVPRMTKWIGCRQMSTLFGLVICFVSFSELFFCFIFNLTRRNRPHSSKQRHKNQFLQVRENLGVSIKTHLSIFEESRDMGCVASKTDEEDDVVSLCRERKRLLKLAIERRYAFADAQCKYNQSLCAVAAAIRLFLARHSSSSSTAFLITFPSTEPFMTNNPTLEPISGQPESQKEVKKTQENVVSHEAFREKKESESEDGEVVCEHFYDDFFAPPPEPSRGRDFEWDFFYPFDEVKREEVVKKFSQSSEEELRMDMEEKGEGERVIVNANNGDMGREEGKRLRVIDTTPKGRELLEALKDVEDYFVRSYDSGLEVSRMLEVNRVRLLSGLEGMKENSNKLITSATLSRSVSFSSSSRRSLLRSASRSSSTCTELNDDLFDDFGGMEAGSHLLTLERLYAWEKKLYEEVKAGDKARKLYERSYFHSKNQDYKQDGREKKQVQARDLQSRLFVAIRRAESISERIQTLRDKELHPQLVELLHALKKNWKTMVESYKTQSQIILEVKSYDCPTRGKFCTESHQLATLQLEAELQNWCACFASYVSTQKAYIELLTCWLSKFIVPELESCTGRYLTPPLLVTCHNWLACLEMLPDKAVICAMKGIAKHVRALLVQQGEEQRQKRKVDGLAKELERKVLAVHKLESRNLESNTFDQKSEAFVQNQKHILDMSRKKLDLEKAKHLDNVKETEQITLKGFRTGFYSVFESLAEFSRASENMYAGLVECRENA